MKKYLIFIIIPIFLIAVFFYFENDDDELQVIYPASEKIKKIIKTDNNFVKSYNGKAAYENLVRENLKKQKNIQLSPKPEKPVKMEEKKSYLDVFKIIEKPVKLAEKKSVFDSLKNEKNTKKLSVKSVDPIKNITIDPIYRIEKDKFYVQLAYSKSQELVNEQVYIIKQNNNFLLKEKNLIYKSKRQNGILYEYLVGPLKDFKHAKLICTKVKLQSNKCIVVKK